MTTCMWSSKRGTPPPRNCYGGVQKMSSLTGGRVGKAKYSNWAMRTAANGCVTSAPMWELTVRTPIIPEIALHGQGRFDAALVDSTMAVAIDAWAYAGYLTVACALDSLTIRLHAGACSAEAEGTAGTVSLFASGLSGVDAGALQSGASVRQPVRPPSVALPGCGIRLCRIEQPWQCGRATSEPMEYEVVRNGSGDLIWED